MRFRLSVESPHADGLDALFTLGNDEARRFAPHADEELLTADELDEAGARVVVARDTAGTAAGMIALVRSPDGSAELTRHVVARGERGQGLGRVLLVRAWDEARTWDEARAQRAALVRLAVDRRNTEALRLYTRMGFAPVPVWGVHAETPEAVCLGRFAE